MKAWGFQYKSNLVWHKIRKDGGSDGRGVGFYFRNVTELTVRCSRKERAHSWIRADHRSTTCPLESAGAFSQAR